METAIRWSPSSTIDQQQFLLVDVTGRSFKLCQVEHYDGKDFRYETLSVHRKVPAFRAFDWSPHNESIVAVGQWSGEATIFRLDDEKIASICLPVKNQRLCNAIAFAKSGLLATGLERVRNDFSLNIWDVEHRLSPNSQPVLGTTKSSLEPVRKFASSEPITSIKFFFGQPDLLLAGVKAACIRLYDLRESFSNPAMQFQTTSVHNISIDLLDENYFASAGTQKDTMIQIWDRRFGVTNSAASLGSGVGNSDLSGPLFEYRRAFDAPVHCTQPSIWSLRFCRARSGYLGALASNGDYKVFGLKKAFVPDVDGFHGQENAALNGESVLLQQVRMKNVHQVERAFDDPKHSRQENSRIVCFDFTNLASPRGRACAITVRGDKGLGIQELKGSPTVFAISSSGELVYSDTTNNIASNHSESKTDSLASLGLRRIKPVSGQTIAMVLKSMRSPSNQPQDVNGDWKIQGTGLGTERGSYGEKPLPSRKAHERLFETFYRTKRLQITEALTTFTVSRRRCMEGYLFDCAKNVQIVADDPWLQGLWEWIERAKRLALNQGMVAQGIDWSYLGIHNIWNNDLGSQNVSRTSGKSRTWKEIHQALELLCQSLDLPDFSSVETSFPAHRKICLQSCGFGLPHDELEINVQELVDQEETTKGAVLAIIHGQPKLAFSALRTTNAPPVLRELSLALAGYVKGATNDIWTETVRDLSTSLSDPYARATLALVRNGSWQDVLAETSLPLRFRLGVALTYLPDADLTAYISDCTTTCTVHGDIEGIALTGLSESSIPLFKSYIQKYHDLQTAVLALAHTTPRYFPSQVAASWREDYRFQLNTYRLFLQRAKFDIQATKLSASLLNDGKPTLAPPSQQVSLRCNNCDQPLDRNPDHLSPVGAIAPASIAAASTGSIFGDSKSGTVCPKCGRHMPRCVVCMMWLGTPDPHSKGAAAANAKVMEKKGQGKVEGRELMKEMATVCKSCWHMSHAGHAEEWFRGHRECPVPGCECRCVEVDVGSGG